MTARTVLSFNMDGLNDLVEKMGSEYVTRVGVLGNSNARSEGEFGNAEIGLTHEFGSATANLPQRSFLRMPLEFKSKELMKGLMSGAVKTAFDKGDFKKVYELMGVKAEEIVQNAFESGGFGQWPPLAESTIKQKGSSAILINMAELRKSITSDVVNRTEI